MITSEKYNKIVRTLKRRKKGATVADICAASAMPLADVRELLPKAADEYSAQLQVTQSGEILYSFPNGFKSRYRGFGVKLKKIFNTVLGAAKIVLTFLFKVWIMVMLVGYFVLFLVLALAAVILSIAAQNNSSNNRRNSSGVGINLFGLLWRIWFVQEVTRPRYGYPISSSVTKKEKNTRPMHASIFSFVFGEEDPNKNWEEKENKAVIAYIQANRGVISIVEYMALTGKNTIEAEEAILSFCARYGGSPEASEDGTIIYRFDDLLLRADSGSAYTQKLEELSPPIKRLKIFSANKKNMNIAFILINAVNLIFGSYFFYNALNSGLLVTEAQYQGASYFYAVTHIILELVTNNPHLFIMSILGIVPLLFSLFFWIIPLVRSFLEKKENEQIKLSNFKKLGFSRIWSKPGNVETASLAASSSSVNECRPKELNSAADTVIKDLGAAANPQVEINSEGKTIYSFTELEREKAALEKYRASVDPQKSSLGGTVFDTQD